MLIVTGDTRTGEVRTGLRPALRGRPTPASSGITTRHRLNPAATDKPTPPSTEPSSYGFTTTSPPRPTTNAGRRRAGPKPRSSVVSSACWPANSGAISDRSAKPGSRSFSLLDSYRSFNAPAESFWSTLKTEFYNQRQWARKADAKLAVGRWLEGSYNRKRRTWGQTPRTVRLGCAAKDLQRESR